MSPRHLLRSLPFAVAAAALSFTACSPASDLPTPHDSAVAAPDGANARPRVPKSPAAPSPSSSAAPSGPARAVPAHQPPAWSGDRGPGAGVLAVDGGLLVTRAKEFVSYDATGKELARLSAKQVSDAYSDKDLTLAARAAVGTVALVTWSDGDRHLDWGVAAIDRTNGRVLWRVNYRGVAFAHGDKAVLTTSGTTQSSYIHDLATGKVISSINGVEGPDHAMALSQDGATIVDAAKDGTVTGYATASGRKKWTAKGCDKATAVRATTTGMLVMCPNKLVMLVDGRERWSHESVDPIEAAVVGDQIAIYSPATRDVSFTPADSGKPGRRVEVGTNLHFASGRGTLTDTAVLLVAAKPSDRGSGIVTTDGRVLRPDLPACDDVVVAGSGFYAVGKNGSYAAFDAAGKRLWGGQDDVTSDHSFVAVDGGLVWVAGDHVAGVVGRG